MLYTLLPLVVYVGFALTCAFWLLASNSFITDPTEIAQAANDARLRKQTHVAYAITLVSTVASVLLARGTTQPWEPAAALVLGVVVLLLLLRARTGRLPFPRWLGLLMAIALAAVCSWWLPPAIGSVLYVALGLGTERRKLTMLGAAGVAGGLLWRVVG